MTKPWGSRCWLLTSPRTGSTYLQYLLNHNAGVPLQPTIKNRERSRYSFGEHLSQKFCSALEEFLKWDPYVSKVHCHHFGAFLLDRPLLKQRIDGPVRFVLLERRDVHQQAVSLAMSNRTGTTQCASEVQQEEFRRSDVQLTDGEMLDCLRAVRDYQQFWRNWLHSEPHLVVTYESLIEAPVETVAGVLDYLQTPHGEISLDVPLRKLGHPTTPEYVERLRELDASRVDEPELTTV